MELISARAYALVSTVALSGIDCFIFALFQLYLNEVLESAMIMEDTSFGR